MSCTEVQKEKSYEDWFFPTFLHYLNKALRRLPILVEL